MKNFAKTVIRKKNTKNEEKSAIVKTADNAECTGLSMMGMLSWTIAEKGGLLMGSMEDSILITITRMLGIGDDSTPFDTDVIVLINTALMTLTQNAVGPKDGFSITGTNETWGDFLTNPVMLEGAKTFVYLKVKMLFDPPGNSFVMDAYKQQAEELLHRLQMQAESVETFDFMDENYLKSKREVGD